jgi:tetratricopeptide (TPR) repeat protein
LTKACIVTSHFHPPKQLAGALQELGRSLDEIGYHHRALTLLRESLALLRSKPDPRDAFWAEIVIRAAGNIAVILRKFGQYEEAGAQLEECLEVQCVANPRPPNPASHAELM